DDVAASVGHVKVAVVSDRETGGFVETSRHGGHVIIEVELTNGVVLGISDENVSRAVRCQADRVAEPRQRARALCGAGKARGAREVADHAGEANKADELIS